MPYDAFADWFEYLNDDCDYEKWSQYFIAGLARLGAGKSGLELGCGSGYFCRALTRAGYRMSGADLSERMLAKAEELSRSAGLRIPYFRADAASLKTPETYDFILSPNDCINYLPPARLPSAFRRIAARLNRGGLFWFDVSSVCKLREKVANTVSCDDRDDVTYLAFNRLKEDCVETEVTLFVRRGTVYERFDELHVRYLHGEEALVRALEAAGFEILSAEGTFGGQKEGSDRLNLICRKKQANFIKRS